MEAEVDVANSDMEFISVNLQCETLLEAFLFRQPYRSYLTT